jgi:hypothetical protein
MVSSETNRAVKEILPSWDYEDLSRRAEEKMQHLRRSNGVRYLGNVYPFVNVIQDYFTGELYRRTDEHLIVGSIVALDNIRSGRIDEHNRIIGSGAPLQQMVCKVIRSVKVAEIKERYGYERAKFGQRYWYEVHAD